MAAVGDKAVQEHRGGGQRNRLGRVQNRSPSEGGECSQGRGGRAGVWGPFLQAALAARHRTVLSYCIWRKLSLKIELHGVV